MPGASASARGAGRTAGGEAHIAQVAPNGEIRRLIARIPDNDDAMVTAVRPAPSGGGVVFRGAGVPFAVTHLRAIAYSGNGSHIGVLRATPVAVPGVVITVEVFSASGDTAFRREYSTTGLPIPAAEVERALAQRPLSFAIRRARRCRASFLP